MSSHCQLSRPDARTVRLTPKTRHAHTPPQRTCLRGSFRPHLPWTKASVKKPATTDPNGSRLILAKAEEQAEEHGLKTYHARATAWQRCQREATLAPRTAHHARATTATRTSAAPASSSNADAVSSVAPVVSTSSTISTWGAILPLTWNEPAALSARAPRPRARWSWALSLTSRGSAGTPSASATGFASANPWSNPLRLSASRVGGIHVTTEGHEPHCSATRSPSLLPSTSPSLRSPASLCSTTARERGRASSPSDNAASNANSHSQHSVHTKAPNGVPQRGHDSSTLKRKARCAQLGHSSLPGSSQPAHRVGASISAIVSSSRKRAPATSKHAKACWTLGACRHSRTYRHSRTR